MRILIIEDEALIQKSLKLLIERHGHQVDATDNAKEAISLIYSNNYDKIVSDLMLKDTTGFIVMEESLNKYTRDQIKKKFFLISAYSSPIIMEQVHSYGCDFEKKPFSSLQSTIDRILTTEP